MRPKCSPGRRASGFVLVAKGYRLRDLVVKTRGSRGMKRARKAGRFARSLIRFLRPGQLVIGGACLTPGPPPVKIWSLESCHLTILKQRSTRGPEECRVSKEKKGAPKSAEVHSEIATARKKAATSVSG